MRLEDYGITHLKLMDSPPDHWMRQYREINKEPKEGWPKDKYGDPIATIPEIKEFRKERDGAIRDLSRESFRPRERYNQSEKVEIKFKGATFTLDSDDEEGIARIMDMIERRQ